ncbi:MAG: LPS export ABC transporter permease LptF [Methylophilaceae bacterium]|nr:LPS export ABC transporter permease LptF [Methylophilaceae bacterium]
MLFKRSLQQELLQTAIGAFAVFFGIVIAQRVTYYIGIAANGSIASNAINTLLGLSMLKFLPMLISLTLFLAVLLTLTRQHRDSEMVIWFSSGMGLTAWIRPVLAFAAPIILLIAFLSLFVTPWATSKSADYKTQLQRQDELATITPGVFKESKNSDRVYFVESFDKLGLEVKNIFIQSMQHQRLGVIVAERGHRETMPNKDNFLIMEKGRRYEGKPGTAEFSSTTFERYALKLESKDAKDQQPVASIQSVPSSVLIHDHNASNNAEIQGRIATPISALILVLLAIPLSFVDPRSGRSGNMIMAILIYIIYNNMISITQAWLTQARLSPVIGLWPVHALFLLITVYLFYRRTLQLPLLPSANKSKGGQ